MLSVLRPGPTAVLSHHMPIDFQSLTKVHYTEALMIGTRVVAIYMEHKVSLAAPGQRRACILVLILEPPAT